MSFTVVWRARRHDENRVEEQRLQRAHGPRNRVRVEHGARSPPGFRPGHLQLSYAILGWRVLGSRPDVSADFDVCVERFAAAASP